jgi:hypothetical protein
MVYLADDRRDRRVAAGSPLAVRIIERDTLWRSFPPRLTTTGVSATTNSVTIEPDRMAVRADMPSRAGRATARPPWSKAASRARVVRKVISGRS